MQISGIAILSLAVLLFGLVHPGAKWLLDSGVSLSGLCLWYVLIRLLVQAPFVLRSKSALPTKKQFATLMALGLVGALLQALEFAALAESVSVPIVTFLVFTHPIWVLVLGRLFDSETYSASTMLSIVTGIAGAALVSLSTFEVIPNPWVLLAPLAAGLCIALWVRLSDKAQSQGCSALTVSFYYDVIAVITLVLVYFVFVGSATRAADMSWLVTDYNFFAIALYSIAGGLLPNLLFYRGVALTSSVLASVVLLFEPILATLISSLTWATPLPPLFTYGAVLTFVAVLLARLPKSRKKETIATVGPALATLCFFVCGTAQAAPRVLHVIQIVPTASDDYVVSSELKQIAASVDLAETEFKRSIAPACRYTIKKDMRTGDEELLFKTIQEVSKQPDTAGLIGFSRSNFARTSARAALGSGIFGMSIGAATEQLKEINPAFISLASTWAGQWKTVSERMKKDRCDKATSLGVFDAKDHLSDNFRKAFLEADLGPAISLSEFATYLDTPNNLKCIFIGSNFPSSQPLLVELIKRQWKGSLFGIGDWNIFSSELKKFWSSLSKPRFSVQVPTGWTPGISPRSARFTKALKAKIGETATPIAAYAYDGTLLALAKICNVGDVYSDSQTLSKLPLLRTYDGLAPTGNLISPMAVVEFGKAP